jgi:NADH-quinone oxidoreductase E subunit
MAVTEMNIDAILEKYRDGKRDSLIPLLQEVQEACGYLSRESVVRIGKRLGLPASKVYGVATFYNQFRFQPIGKFHVQVCRGTACHVKGSASVLETVKRTLNIEPGQTSRDGIFSLEVVACIGACGLAPVMCINGEFHASLTPDSAKEILGGYRRKAETASK